MTNKTQEILFLTDRTESIKLLTYQPLTKETEQVLEEA